ncbi:MAG: hypothetical protein AB1465_06110 [Patescibacteria group bacterium]
MKYKKRMIMLLGFVILFAAIFSISCGSNSNLESQEKALKLEKGITRIPLGNGYWLEITGIHKHKNKYLPGGKKGCLAFLGKGKNHLSVIFNRDGILDEEDPLLDIHVTWWKRSIKPKFCAGVVATKGKYNKYGPGNIVFCYSNCQNSKLERIQETWDQIKTAYFAGQVGVLAVIGAYYLAWYTFPIVIEIYAPKLLEYAKSLIGSAPAFPTEFGSSPPPSSPPIPESEEPSDDDLDEPDDPDQPVGPNGCGCNLPEDDGNICFDDSFGKPNPNPQEYKPELTVVGRDENFLYIFGKDAALFNRAIFWADPNTEGLENCESYGQFDGTFMVHKLQPCRTWFSLTNESKTIWLSPDSTTTRVAEGVSVVPYGQGYNFVLTCGAEPNILNLLQPQDQKNSECLYLSLDEALYANKNVCFDDTIAGLPLPQNVNPELTIVARRANYLHIFGANAEIYHHGVFWANPNPDGLANFEINGEWNGFSTVFKLPPCRPWFALSNNEKTIWLSPNASTTKVEEGISIVNDGSNFNFILTCGSQPNSLNLLLENDFTN